VVVLLVGSPLLGAWLSGHELGPYLRFPPQTAPVVQPPFSPVAFTVLAGLILAFVVPLAWRVARAAPQPTGGRGAGGAFPRWGWLGVALVAVAWTLAWTRFDWFAPIQSHTFTPLWIGFIVVLNALTEMRTGSSLMRDRPRYFVLLFPVSAVYWWFFEFVNRFVGNWHYVNVERFSALEYTMLATMSFSTVLPAVASMTRLLSSFPRLQEAWLGLPRIRLRARRLAASIALAGGCGALAGVGAWPEYFYPLVWVAPILVVFAVLALSGEPTGLEPLGRGDWRGPGLSAFAALACGFFWELWNYGSLAHWEYAIPFVDRYHVFEMPLLGYAGYLPFGVECFAVGMLVSSTRRS